MRIARLLCLLLVAMGILAIPVQSRAQVAVGISVRIGPPVLPVYVQPICPEPGYIWIPGYWAYGPDGYFWVPGTWIFPPEEGLLWTPGYWGFADGFYVWHAGYWGPTVGYYGGINYGFGYTGVGFYGGYWRGRTYYYNRAVTNVKVTVVHNTYNTTVVNNTTVNRVSYNGGPGGITARPTRAEMDAARERRVSLTAEQTQHFEAARSNRELLASVNHGRPEVAAIERPGRWNDRGRGRGRDANDRVGGENRPPEVLKEKDRRENSPPGRGRPDRPSDWRPPEGVREDNRSRNDRRTFGDRRSDSRRPDARPVNPGLEQEQQREVEKMRQRQEAERQKVERQKAQEQQKLQQRRGDEQRQQQLQQRHQQQMEQMQSKHDQQAQKLQERQRQEVQKQDKKEQKDRGGRPPGR